MIGRSSVPAAAAAAVVLAAAAAGLTAAIGAIGAHLTKLPIQAKDNRQMHQLPAEFPSWERQGADRLESVEILEELGTRNYLSRVYRMRGPEAGANPPTVDLHLTYYTGMIDTVPHVPDRCNVGAGMKQDGDPVVVKVPLDRSKWTRDESADPSVHGGTIWTMRSPLGDAPVRLPRNIENLELRVVPFQSPAGRFFSGYFFLANGGHVASADEVRMLAFRLTDDYAYYAKVQFSSSSVRTGEELAGLAGKMLDEMLPEIMRCVPDWVEVRNEEAARRRGAAAAKN
ncbi:MAG: exosortase-associated EpsI family protein [Phycisphaerales bacterium]|nr:exosortase-associated EpsI family protein [Phycisphaerales bacterium]